MEQSAMVEQHTNEAEQPTSIERAARRRLPAFYFVAQVIEKRKDISLNEFIRIARQYSETPPSEAETRIRVPVSALDSAMAIVERTKPPYLGLLLSPLDENMMVLIKQDAETQYNQ